MSDENIKYFFGWYRDNRGQLYSVKWIEDEGVPIGGEPARIEQIKEITPELFTTFDLQTIELIYPYNPENKEEKPK